MTNNAFEQKLARYPLTVQAVARKPRALVASLIAPVRQPDGSVRPMFNIEQPSRHARAYPRLLPRKARPGTALESRAERNGTCGMSESADKKRTTLRKEQDRLATERAELKAEVARMEASRDV